MSCFSFFLLRFPWRDGVMHRSATGGSSSLINYASPCMILSCTCARDRRLRVFPLLPSTSRNQSPPMFQDVCLCEPSRIQHRVSTKRFWNRGMTKSIDNHTQILSPFLTKRRLLISPFSIQVDMPFVPFSRIALSCCAARVSVR